MLPHIDVLDLVHGRKNTGGDWMTRKGLKSSSTHEVQGAFCGDDAHVIAGFLKFAHKVASFVGSNAAGDAQDNIARSIFISHTARCYLAA